MLSSRLDRFVRLFVFFSAILGVSTERLSAMSVRPPDFRELVAESDTIVRGEVVAVESRKVTNQAGREVIKTFVRVRIEDQMKGAAATELSLAFLGGRVGEEALTVAGMPTFRVGQKDFLFIARNGEVLCPLVAAAYGRYPIAPTADAAAEPQVLRSDHSTLRSLSQIPAPLSPTANFGAHGGAAGMSVARFTQAIRAEVAISGPTRRVLP